MTDFVGQQIGGYRLVKKLGEGGFAEVYLAENVHVKNILVAIKILKDMLTERAKEQFFTEASTISDLKHPNIIRLRHFDLYNGLPYLVMDYIKEGSLRNRYPEGTKLALSTIVSYVKQIADALQHAHNHGIVHRDIKPDNILWENDNTLLVSDFGIATASFTQGYSQQEKIGTLPYMSPEHFRAKAQSASDQYSLGIVVYEWLCGIPPFTEGDFIQMGYQHAIVPPPSLHDQITISSAVEEVVMKALAKEPRDRFDSIAAFSKALENAAPASFLEPEDNDVIEPLQPNQHNNINNDGVIDVAPPPENNTPQEVYMVSPPDNTPPRQEEVYMVPLPPLPIPIDNIDKDSDSVPIPLVTPLPEDKPEATGGASPIPWRQRSDKRNVVGVPYQASNTGTVGRGASGDAVVPSLTGNRRNPGGPRHKRSRRQLLSLALIAGLLLSLLLCGGIALAALGTLRTAFGSLQRCGLNASGVGTLSATITITPKSALLSNTYILTGIPTGTPDPSKRQVQARQLTFTTKAQSKTVSATGQKQTPGTRATGTISFYNSSTSAFFVAANTVFTDAQGRQIANDAIVGIPAGNPGTGTYGHATASAYAITIGASGNIPAGDITNYPCCGDAAVGVSTTGAFTGGQDPQNYTFVQQSDIDSVANSFKQPALQSAQTALNGLKHANEQFVNKPQCTSNVTSNPNVGDKSTSVTVSVTGTCTGEVFDQAGAETIAANLLKGEADKDTGGSYVLSGTVVSSLTSVTANGNLTVLAKAQGVWVYQFDVTAKTNLARFIVGKAQNDATALLLQQAGVSKVDGISISGGGRSALPTDFNQITIVVQPVAGVQGIPTPGVNTTPTTRPPTISVTVQGS